MLLVLLASSAFSSAAEVLLHETISPAALAQHRDVWPDGDATIYNDFLVFHAPASVQLASGDRLTFDFQLESPFQFSLSRRALYGITYLGLFHENQIGNVGAIFPGPAFNVIGGSNLKEADIPPTPSRMLNLAGSGSTLTPPFDIDTMLSLQVWNNFQLQDDSAAGFFSGFQGTLTVPDGFPLGQYTDLEFRVIGHLRTSGPQPPALVSIVPEPASMLALFNLAIVGIFRRRK